MRFAIKWHRLRGDVHSGFDEWCLIVPEILSY
jgi:hypothetical protein